MGHTCSAASPWWCAAHAMCGSGTRSPPPLPQAPAATQVPELPASRTVDDGPHAVGHHVVYQVLGLAAGQHAACM